MLPSKIKQCLLIGLLVVFLVTTCLAENSTDNIIKDDNEESKESAIIKDEESSKEEMAPDVPPLIHDNPPERVEEKKDIVPSVQNSDNTESVVDVVVDKNVIAESDPKGKKTPPIQKSGRLIVPYDYANYDSLKSRVAPPLESQRGGIPYVISEQRLKEIRKEFMYWYFDQGGSDNEGDYQSNIQGSSPQVHKNLNFQLPFYGFRFNYTRVSMNGYLEFSDPPPHFATYPLVFPNKDWPKKNDPSFIGIFYSKMRIGSTRTEDIDQRTPGVYFRLERDLQTRTDQFGVEVRERLKWDIREGVIGSETFEPKHAVIVTWKNMTFAGGIDNSLYVTNTFQLVLATDEVYTYAIFNYLDIKWTTHTEAKGDTSNGEGGTPAFVGFNAGNGTQAFEYYPYSQRSTIRDLTGRGWANGFKGRHIFRIDEKILLGTCNKDISGANLPLVFAPESGNMLGGTVVNITGPCFELTDKVTCRFDTEEVRGTVVDTNRAICVQPMNVFAEGYIRFEVAIGSGKYNWKGKFFIETPATAAERIYFEDNNVYEKSPREIKITWEKANLTTNENAPIRISLWGYRETTIRPELLYIDSIETSTTNTGQYVISPGAFRNRENYKDLDIDNLQFGFIQINLTQSQNFNGLDIIPVIWSKPMPLGWYFGPQWEKEYGSRWPHKLCDNWLKNDRYLKNFANELPQCPCTLKHALNDKGRFLPDFDCDKDANPKCMYHKGALHCVRSGAPSLEGSEQQCCYDKNEYLMLSYDQKWGSRPFRSHNLGYLPWNEANKVPTLSQWFHDIAPYYSCCMWQDEQSVGCETFRFERRPSQDCVAYQPPGVATVFGDPHIVTFDNLEYTFNGKGEFVLVRTNTKDLRLDVQGRFEQLPQNAYGEVRATQMTSVATQGNNSAVIEVRLRPRHAQWRYRLDVFADGKRIYFDRPSLKFQHFPGVTVYTPTYILNQSEVIIMYESGAGVEVIENKGYMSARVYLPWQFINKTTGLMGNWSFDIQDDLIKPDGSKFTAMQNMNDFESLHREFGLSWTVEDKENPNVGRALFHREFSRTSSYFTNRTFLPVFRVAIDELIPENRSIYRVNAKDLCGGMYQCEYDYAMSLNRDMAHFTQNYLNSYTQIRELNNKRIISCGVLETPRFGRKSNFLFVPGTKVTFECNQDFILIGDPRRTCLPNGTWDVPEYGYTECLRKIEYESRTAGIVTAIVLAILLPLIFCICGGIYYILNNKNKSNKSWVFTQPRSRSNSRMNLSRAGDDSRQISPIYSPEESPSNRILSPVSDTSTLSSTTKKKRINYDGVYHTHEPIQGVPDVPWDDKDWEALSSPEGSEYGTGKPTKMRLVSDPDYVFMEEDEYENNDNVSRTGTMDSGLGGDHHGSRRPYSVFAKPSDEKPKDPDLSRSQPILNYGNEDYAEVIKPTPKKPYQRNQSVSSMSSRITAV